MSLQIINVSFSYSSAVDVLDDVSMSLGPGWTGVVGANGAGKSTLLRLVAGELAPTSGSIHLPSVLAPVHCRQTVDQLTPDIVEFAAADGATARRWHGRLELDPKSIERWATLSPGERKRWQIGAALAAEPDVLILDEPTNHLDDVAYELLVDALESFRRHGLVVSHDRALLNRLCRRTALVRGGSVTVYDGGYDTAHGAWTAADAAAAYELESLKAERKKIERRLGDQRRAAEARSAAHKRRVRHGGVRDPDARSMEKKGRHESGELAGARRRSLERSAAERLDAEIADVEIERALGRAISFGYEPSRKATLLRFKGPLRIDTTTLVDNVDVALERTDRVWLRGRNGSGKSTLLATLAAGAALPDGRLVHLPQELSATAATATLEEVRRLPNEARGRVLSLVAALGADPARVLASDLPSPGEARKLVMALGLGAHAWCLLLDEPTNHLDLPTIERLEAALAEFPGAMIVVSHDTTFAEAVTDTRWVIQNGALLR